MRSRPAWRAAALSLVAAACAPALRPTAGPPPGAGPEEAAAAAAEVHALAAEVEREPTAPRRAALAERAVAAGQRCQAGAPDTPACDYALAIALGLQARERPSTWREGLAQMALRLRRAAAAAPELDHAGPDRVLALLLLRAPGWPLGPGDPEEGLAAARRAVARAQEHAPNQLALAEALLQAGERDAGHAAARRALALARAAAEAGEPEAAAWARQARALADAP